MYRDVGKAVPKPTATRYRDRTYNTAQITPSLHLFLYVAYFFNYALRLLGNNIVHEKKM